MSGEFIPHVEEPEMILAADGGSRCVGITPADYPVAYGPWGLPIPGTPVPVEVLPALAECGDDEAVGVLLEAVQGKYWAESWQGRLKRMREAGYVLAKVKS